MRWGVHDRGRRPDRPVTDDHKNAVEAGYDRVAERYLATKDPDDPLALAALREMAGRVPTGAAVLDLGCGAGIPATRWLVARGFAVIGVDFSRRQLELARRNAPGATFVRADMTRLDLAPDSFDAVVALHSIIHVPREGAPGPAGLNTPLAQARWAPTRDPDHHGFRGRGRRLGGLGCRDALEPPDEETNKKMVDKAGFEILRAEPRTGRGTGDDEETWLWVLTRKPANEGNSI